MLSIYRRLVAAGLLFAISMPASSAMGENSQVTVMMVSDSGFHKPSEFYRHVAEPLAKQCIFGFQNLLARGVLWACGQTLTAVVTSDCDAPPAKAVTAANRDFKVPAMSQPAIDEADFKFTDVGAKIPNYTSGAQWGTQEAPLTLMKNPLPAEESTRAYSTPEGFGLSLWAKDVERELARAGASPHHERRAAGQADCHELG